MNGAIDTSTLTCSTCHGNATLVASGLQDPNVAAAPTGTGAPDTYGNTAIATANGVGVHAAHVLGTRSKPVLCNACHTVPGTQIHKTGVATAGTVALANLSTFGGIANATYAGAGGTCSNVYCHGNFTGGAGAIATPTWKTAGALSCTSCHGAPPALNATTHHPANTACASCHGTGYTASTVVAATHVDGTVNLSRTGCTLCHGDLTQTAVAATSDASAPGFNASSADTTGATDRHRRRRRRACGPPHRNALEGHCPRLQRVPHRSRCRRRRPRDGHRHGRRSRHGGLRHARQDRRHHHRRLRRKHHRRRRERSGHLLQRLLPRQLQERRHDGRSLLARRHGRRRLRLLPRPSPRRNAPGELGLRELPHRVHGDAPSTRPRTSTAPSTWSTSPAPPATARRRA